MRILWHGIGPWHKTGYGQQTAVFAPRLAALGHEVVIAFMGRTGIDDKPATAHPDAKIPLEEGHWQGIPIIGCGLTEFGLPMPLQIRAAFKGHDPDLIIVLKDPWVLSPEPYRRHRTAIWAAVDCNPMSAPDLDVIRRSGATPIAMSRFGFSMMRAAGLSPAYVPHGLEPGTWTPGSREEARDLIGLPERVFIAGINATNVGPRKAWGEQFTAFARFRRQHKDALLLCHTAPEHPEGINLRELAAAKGIDGAVRFGAGVNMTAGQMASWYRSLDVLLNCSYGEGFGLPILEALACGIPVIGTDCSAISEKIPPGAGWLARSQPWWNPQHEADWAIPRIDDITTALNKAARKPLTVPPEYAADYDADHVTAAYWKPLLEELCPS